MRVGEVLAGFLLLKKIFFCGEDLRKDPHYPHRGSAGRFAGVIFGDFMRINVQKLGRVNILFLKYLFIRNFGYVR